MRIAGRSPSDASLPRAAPRPSLRGPLRLCSPRFSPPSLPSLAFSSLLVACATPNYRSSPDPAPVPEARRPAGVLRQRVPRGAAGEVVLDDRDGLSPDEAALLAIDKNPRLRAARAERGLGEAELLSASVLPNPRLDASLDFPVAGGEAKVLGYGAGLSWNVTPLLARSARVSAARSHAASIDLDIAWQEWQVAQAARLHAVRAIYLERRIAVAHELEATWRQRSEALRQARGSGAVTELEVTTAERSFADAQVVRLELEQHLVSARADLARALGVDPTRKVALDVRFALPTGSLNREALIAELPQRRLDLIALEHAQRSRDEALRAAIIARFPPLDLGFHAQREVDGRAALGPSLTFDLPFFDRNQAAVARERALRTQVEAEYDARLLEARADVQRALDELALVNAQLVAAREAAQASGRLAEQARAASVNGALSPLLAADLLERSYASRLRVLEVEQTLIELYIALAVASGVDVR